MEINAEIPFFIFGQGNRRKYLYQAGKLVDLTSGHTLLNVDIAHENIVGHEYCVELHCKSSGKVTITEDENGITLMQKGRSESLAAHQVKLPKFENHPHQRLLRILHHEILINIVEGCPVPNFMVYDKPWYRDAAMIAMVLEITGNTFLLDAWIKNINNPFDRNNAGNAEPDNLGQLLYLISLTGKPTEHPLIPRILAEAQKVTYGGHLNGLTDGRQHPVYQTKWMKFGLRRMGLYDDYTVPDIEDGYAGLCWWDRTGIILPAKGYLADNRHYPYLSWAEAHFLNAPPPFNLSRECFPLTWESRASQAEYEGMRIVNPEYVTYRICKPHTWHAAEMFLYLYELSD